MVAHRERVFRARGIESLAALRAAHAAGQLPELPAADVVLLIDNWPGQLRRSGRRRSMRCSPTRQRLRRARRRGRLALERDQDGPEAGRLRNPDRAAPQRAGRLDHRPAPAGRTAQGRPGPDARTGRQAVRPARAAAGGRRRRRRRTCPRSSRPRRCTVRSTWQGPRAPQVRILPLQLPRNQVGDEIRQPAVVPIGVDERGAGAGVPGPGRPGHATWWCSATAARARPTSSGSSSSSCSSGTRPTSSCSR